MQNLSYGYDKFGNLASRKDNLRNLEETFHYDKMNRLTDIYLGTTHSQIVYDPLGRMTDKQADGQTVFANAAFAAAQGQPSRPHAMTSAETVEGVFPSALQEITYTGFDKVKTIAEGGNTLAYTYGHDQQRIRMVENVGDITRTKDYVGFCEFITEDDEENTTEKTITYLVGPYGVFAVVERQDNEETVHYILKDHLGSWTTITDSEGNVEQELSFDAWGNLRDPDTWTGYTVPELVEAPMFDRGYTGHEHMTAFGLINMNGRCYDPLTSSFLSVDAYVQDPTSAQAFNRYAYCGHNPLRYTDPTGWYRDGYGYQPPQQSYDPAPRWHSDDPNDVLWGRSVHPSEAGNMNRPNTTTAGYTIGNGYVTGNVPPSHLKAILAWRNNPCKETSQALKDLGIELNVGCLYGEFNGIPGYCASTYSWTDATGQFYSAKYLEYYGGNENGAYTLSNRTPESYENQNARVSGWMVNVAGLYTYVEGVLHYSETLGKWTDRQGNRRPLTENGNQYTGGKLKYGKAIGEKFRRASGMLNAVGIWISIGQYYSARTIDDKIKYGADVVFGGLGYAPGGSVISTFWFFGGRELVFQYGYTVGELMKEGINPGMPAYQPFK